MIVSEYPFERHAAYLKHARGHSQPREEGRGFASTHARSRHGIPGAMLCTLRPFFAGPRGSNLHEGIANLFSLAGPPDGSKFLMNPYGKHWSAMKASDLVLLDVAPSPRASAISST